MALPTLTKEQIDFIKSDKHKVTLSLKGMEVLAIFSLGQMHNKIVRLKDGVWGKTKIGVFYINHINNKTDFDFSDSSKWKTVTIDAISVSLIEPNEWGGENTDTYNSLFDISEIALLK